MTNLLSSTFFFKGFISPNCFGLVNLKLTNIVKKRQKEMYSSNVSIYKRNYFTKDVNELYIWIKY